MSAEFAPAQAVSPSELLGLLDLAPKDLSVTVRAMAERQAQAQTQASARAMLALMEALVELDPSSVSHLMRAVMRLALGQSLLAVEKTALRIAGLADLQGETLRPTAEGEAILSLLAGRAAPDLEQPRPATAETNVAPAPAMPEAFATMRFGEITFEVAEGATPDSLLFRTSDQGEWLPLGADRASGWTEIGAEMLNRATDTTGTYVQTHTIRLPEADLGEDVHRFELDHLHWWIKGDLSKAAFSTDPKSGWEALDTSLKGATLRDLGIAAAERMLPGFRVQIEADVQSWVRRMAHAAAIMPVLPRVA